jgi:fimbrial chaperone protein
MRRFFWGCFALTLPFVMPGLADAGNFKVTPTSLSLDGSSKTSILKLTNVGTEDVTVQIEAKEWLARGTAEDLYMPTRDLIFFPKIVTLPKGEQALVRVGYQQAQETQERAFRLFIQELPVIKPGEMALKMTLTLSLPVFIAPLPKVVDWELAGAHIEGELVQVKVKNTGNVHLVNERVHLAATDSQGLLVYEKSLSGWYVLAGATRSYSVDLPKDPCLQAKEIILEVTAGKGKKSVSLPVDPKMCVGQPASDETEGKGVSRKPTVRAE